MKPPAKIVNKLTFDELLEELQDLKTWCEGMAKCYPEKSSGNNVCLIVRDKVQDILNKNTNNS